MFVCVKSSGKHRLFVHVSGSKSPLNSPWTVLLKDFVSHINLFVFFFLNVKLSN